MSRRTLETFAWFAAYGAIILFLLTWNGASTTYNAVYVERTSADWLPDATRDYEPGTTISGSEVSPYFGEGWWRPEPSERWGRGSRSTIELVPTADIPAGSRLVASFGAHLLRDTTTRPVRVLLNGAEIAVVDVSDEASELYVAVPELPAGVPVSITFVVEPAKSPLSQGESADPRELGVMFVQVTLG